MPQSPLAFLAQKPVTNAFANGLLDAGTNSLMTTNGGNQQTYNVAAAAVIKTGAGRVAKIIVQTAPSAGNLTVNDCATTGAAAIGNQIISLAFGNLTIGTQIFLDWPLDFGLVISSVGTGGVYAVSYI